MDIKVTNSSKALSAAGGLLIFKPLLERSFQHIALSRSLPFGGPSRNHAQKKFHHLVYSFLMGADCLDDCEVLGDDHTLRIVCPKVYSAKALGDFLRSFARVQCKELNRKLADLAFLLRPILHERFHDNFILDLDSTVNRQYGKKMEGVVENYEGVRSLETIQAFDEFGLQYWNEVRPGNTFSAEGAELIIHEVLSRMPKNSEYRGLRPIIRADSAFCNINVFNACQSKNADFVISMRANMFSPLLKNVISWQDQNPNKENRILFYDGRECQVGETLYFPERSHKPFRVIIIRALKLGMENALFEHQDNYDYFSWVTTIGEHRMSWHKVIKFYRKRGQAENYIRELKYNFDLKHYPCQRLSANNVYGTIAAFAYNFMRFLSVSRNKKHPCYAKQFRLRWLYLPCQVIHHARQVSFKFMNHHYKEVVYWIEHIKNLQFGYT